MISRDNVHTSDECQDFIYFDTIFRQLSYDEPVHLDIDISLYMHNAAHRLRGAMEGDLQGNGEVSYLSSIQFLGWGCVHSFYILPLLYSSLYFGRCMKLLLLFVCYVNYH